MIKVLPAPSTLYRRVAVAAWDCVSAAGHAADSLAAVQHGRPRLILVDGAWRGEADLGGAQARGGTAAATGDGDGDGASDGRLARLALAAARHPWSAIAALRGPIAWSVSSSKGDPHAFDAARVGDPRRFVDGMPGMLGQSMARELGARLLVPCPVAAACSTGLYALLSTADLIESGVCAHGLAGAADSSLTPLMRAGFDALGVACGARLPTAFADDGLRPTGFAPAEGAGFVALAASGPWRLVAGVRLGDATHETHFGDPRTLAGCLAALWRASPRPDLIVTHGTGTAAGDAYERIGLEAGPWSSSPRMHCKPIIGHCLGASGTVELALALSSPARSLWKISLGFGGHLAAVALER